MIRVENGSDFSLEALSVIASGRLDPALVLLIETAAEMRGLSLQAGEAAAGAALERETPALMSEGALEQVLARISARAAKNDKKRPSDADSELISIPAALRARIVEAEEQSGWKTGGGLTSLDLALGGECKAEIMRIPAGAGVPKHTHGGQELTLCLSGGFSDGIGAYGPGDVSITDPSITHRPVADSDGPCYVLAVTDAGLKFTGLLGVMQKLVGR